MHFVAIFSGLSLAHIFVSCTNLIVSLGSLKIIIIISRYASQNFKEIACINYELWIFKNHGFPISFVLWRLLESSLALPNRKCMGKLYPYLIIFIIFTCNCCGRHTERCQVVIV